MIISQNLSAMYSNRQLGIVDNKSAKSTERLSSGYRINRSADDAAGLAISEKMRRQIRGLQQGAHNAQDGISMVQVADGAMNEIQDMLHRGNELSIKAANGTLSYDDRCNIQAEIDHLVTEIDSISTRTKFNEIKVLSTAYKEEYTGIVIKGTLPSWVKAGPSLGAGYMSERYVTDELYEEYDSLGVLVSSRLVPIKHAASTIDLSGFQGTDAQKKDLFGTGFYFTCCTCSNHYSIKFTNEATNSLTTSGDHFIYNVAIANVTNADDLLDTIIDATENGNPNNHYTYLDIDKTKKELVIYDNRFMSAYDKPLLSDPTYSYKWPNWRHWSSQATANKNRGLFGEGVAYDSSDFNKEQTADISLLVGAEVRDRITLRYLLYLRIY